MLKNKRGLSDVVTTLMIILLVLISVGIIWVVVRNVVETGTENIDIGAKCLEIDVKPTAVTQGPAPGTKTVTLERAAGGDIITGIKIVFKNSTASSVVYDASAYGISSLSPLETKTTNPITPSIFFGVAGSNKVQVTVYFKNDKGEEQLCAQSTEYSF